MTKICDKVILEPLPITYKNCVDTGIFSNLWKKSNPDLRKNLILFKCTKMRKTAFRKLGTNFFVTYIRKKF